MPFSDIKGQDRAIDYLKKSISQQRLAHAMLFSGPDGVGKKTAALALAQTVNCTEPNEYDACGRCLSCNKISHSNHPNVKIISADGQSIKIDQIRDEVQHQVMLKPTEGKYKVYIIDGAELSTIEASNSLLKILEEPPETVLIILITAQPFSLLETIRSRCQEVRFNPIAADLLGVWLQERLTISPIEAKTLALLSEGRPSEALRLADPETKNLRRTVIEVIQKNNQGEWAKLAETLGDLRSDLPESLRFMLLWFRDVLVLSKKEDTLVVNLDYKAALLEHAKRENSHALVNKCRLIIEAINQLRRNINHQLLLEVLLMRLSSKAV